MTAATAYVERPPRLALVRPGAQGPATPGVYQRIGTGAKSIWTWLCEAPGRFWGWLKRTLHLQPVIDKIKEVVAWTAKGVRAFLQAMGFQGMSGLGLLTVTTGPGRWLINTLIVNPLRWVIDRLADTWRGVESFFADNLGDFGNWVEARMGRIEEFFWGRWDKDPAKCREGFFPTIGRFYREHIAVHMDLGSPVMRALRLLGTLMFGLQAIAALPLLGLTGAALTYTSYGAQAALYGTSLWQSFFLGRRIGEIPEVNEWINRTKGEVKAAAEDRKKVDFAGNPSRTPQFSDGSRSTPKQGK